MTKMGMKPVEGITRVTLKTNKNFILYIDKPDVMKTSNDSSYLVFGEAKFHDFNKSMAAKVEDSTPKDAADETQTGDHPEESITALIEYTKCSRAEAIAALNKTNGDVV